MSAPHGNKSGKAKSLFVAGLFFAGCEALGYICSDIAEGLGGYFAMVVHWIALCCSAAGFFAAWHEMVEGKNALNIWIKYGIVCAFMAFIAYFVWKPKPPPKLTLVLYAHTTDLPDENLDFTNDFLFLKTDKGLFHIPNNLPFLVVDVAQDEPQFTLKFGIFNNSTPPLSSSEFDVEKPEMRIWIANPDLGETIKWSSDAKWDKWSTKGIMTNGTEINFPGQALRYQFPNSLAAGTGDSAPGITFNMQEKPSGVSVAVLTSGKDVSPILYCFKLLAVPSDGTVSKIRFDTNDVIRWQWKYRPVAYRPIDTPLIISPSRIQLSDGKNTFGKQIMISNPSSSNLYAITLSVEIENGVVPISSPTIEISQPKQRETSEHGELQLPFEARFDFVGPSQDRLFVIPVLAAHEDRSFWIRGTILTNSFADISIWQSMNSFPDVTYTTNGMWMWPIFLTNSPWWIHVGEQPMGLRFGIMAWRGEATNGFTNDSQIIPSRP